LVVLERFTDFHTVAYKASGGRLGGKAYGVPVVLIESVGRKSGKHRTHPLLCLPDGDNLRPDRFQGRDRPPSACTTT